jgi:hypothetical protein
VDRCSQTGLNLRTLSLHKNNDDMRIKGQPLVNLIYLTCICILELDSEPLLYLYPQRKHCHENIPRDEEKDNKANKSRIWSVLKQGRRQERER